MIAGITSSFGLGKEDVYILKLNQNGDKIWEKTFGGLLNGETDALQVLPDGSIIVVGRIGSFEAGWDVYVLKLDKNGNKVWEKTFGGSGNDGANALHILSDGTIIVAGYKGSYGVLDPDVYILKLDKNGSKIWEKTFGGSGFDWAEALQVLSDSSIIIAGYTGSFGAGGWDVYVLKLDENGNKIWEKTFGGSGTDGARALQVLPDGTIIIGGWTTPFGVGKSDVYVLKKRVISIH